MKLYNKFDGFGGLHMKSFCRYNDFTVNKSGKHRTYFIFLLLIEISAYSINKLIHSAVLELERACADLAHFVAVIECPP